MPRSSGYRPSSRQTYPPCCKLPYRFIFMARTAWRLFLFKAFRALSTTSLWRSRKPSIRSLRGNAFPAHWYADWRRAGVRFHQRPASLQLPGDPSARLGDLFVKMRCRYRVDFASLVQYLVSFRKENHFHEEVVEMIYKRLWDTFRPARLMVAAMYTRRGGIDINPLRCSHREDVEPAFLSPDTRLGRRWRQ